jgi:hypothetical protein
MAKVKTVNKTMKDPELIEMFNKMVGASDPEPSIVIPKYERILTNAKEITDLLEKIVKSPAAIAGATLFADDFRDLTTFISVYRPFLVGLELETNDQVFTGEQLRDVNSDPSRLTEFLVNMKSRYKVTDLAAKWQVMRNCLPIKEMIMIARNLRMSLGVEQERVHAATHNLENRDALSYSFIVNCDGDNLQLFNFTRLNFKLLFIADSLTEEHRKYLLLILYYINVRALEIVQDITSPDIDVEKFSEILVRNIGDLRKHIPRCDKAFDRIEKSVGLLKNNFGEYYKDFVTAQNGNAGIFIESFVMDVANNSRADLQTARQFRQIINFYRQRMSSSKIDDPKIKKMMDLIGENLDILETKMTNTKKETTPTADAPAENAPSVAPAENAPGAGTSRKARKRRAHRTQQ